MPDFIRSLIDVLLFIVILTVYHLFILQRRLDLSQAEQRGYYVLDVEGLTAFKAAQVVRAYQEGKIDLSSPESFSAFMDDFRGALKKTLAETVGNAPVFLPKSVVSAEGFIDLTPLFASRLGIDMRRDNEINSNSTGADIIPGTPME
jgi:hypothetical protein